MENLFLKFPAGARHLGGDERYDGNGNAIVPAEERRAFLTTKRLDAEVTEAMEYFSRTREHLERTLAECSKRNDAAHVSKRF